MGETTAERAARLIRDYDGQGAHRTGTAVDRASALWLAEEVRAAGHTAALEPVPLDRLDPIECSVECAGERIEAIPLFDSGPTGTEGLRGTLGPFGGDAAIAYGRVSARAAPPPGYVGARRESRHAALLAVTGGEACELPPGFALLNADSFREPFGPPCLQLPSQAWEPLRAAHERGEAIRVLSRASRQPVEALNVTASLQGRRPELPPIVVMTPRSGWWGCASERGGGLVVFVELLHALREIPPARTVHFVASTGHELGHLGLDAYLAAREPLVAGAFAWIHLGASFAAATRPHVHLQPSDAQLADLATRAMRARGAALDGQAAIGNPPLGEARNIHDGGGRYLSLIGGNGRFHSPEDRWPEAVDLDRLVATAHAFVDIVGELAADS